MYYMLLHIVQGGLSVTHIFFDSTIAPWHAALQKHRPTWPHVYALPEGKAIIRDQYSVRSFPTVVFTDGTGESLNFSTSNSEHPEIDYIRFINKELEQFK